MLNRSVAQIQNPLRYKMKKYKTKNRPLNSDFREIRHYKQSDEFDDVKSVLQIFRESNLENSKMAISRPSRLEYSNYTL